MSKPRPRTIVPVSNPPFSAALPAAWLQARPVVVFKQRDEQSDPAHTDCPKSTNKERVRINGCGLARDLAQGPVRHLAMESSVTRYSALHFAENSDPQSYFVDAPAATGLFSGPTNQVTRILTYEVGHYTFITPNSIASEPLLRPDVVLVCVFQTRRRYHRNKLNPSVL